MASLQRPVLSIAIDAVSGLNGDDDCRGLWSVFSRCRDSIEEGRRLENMSWRLWNKELGLGKAVVALPVAPQVPQRLPLPSDMSDFSSDSESSDSHTATDSQATSSQPEDGSTCQPLPQRPVASALPPFERPLAFVSASHPTPVVSRPPLLDQRAHSTPTQYGPLQRAKSQPGKIISQLLPNKLSISSTKASHAAMPSFVPSSPSETVPHHTPSTSHEAPLGLTIALHPPPDVSPATAPSPSLAAPDCPTVVVVNPTPHTTPPPTPNAAQAPGAVTSSFVPLTTMGASLRPPGAGTSSANNADPEDASGRPTKPRFFLSHESGSPEQSPDSEASTPGSVAVTRDSGTSRTPATPVGTVDERVSPNSVSSNNFARPGSASSSYRLRKGKETVKPHVVGRPTPQHRPALQHRTSHQRASMRHATPSAPGQSVNGDDDAQAALAGVASEQTVSRVPSAPAPANDPALPLVPPLDRAGHTRPVTTAAFVQALLAPASRRVEVISSEFETDSEAEDSSWASDDDSAEEGEKPHDIAREAALEAARQRDMFAKRPVRSFSTLDRPRPQQGLLSSLFRPEKSQLTQALQRHSQSAQELPGRRLMGPLTAQAVTAVAQPVTALGHAAPAQARYRPRARPDGADDETDSGEEDPDNTVQVSSSIAQRRLEAIAGPRRHRAAEALPRQPEVQQAGPSVLANVTLQPQVTDAHAVAVPYPYNLPPPLPQATPRTTRRNMLSHEMSESLRMNLLWQRHVTNRSIGALPRARSTANTSSQLASGGADGRQPNDPDAGREARRRADQRRNRSFGGDFHMTGW